MSIQSMTGFGRSQVSSNNFIVTVEVKSVNHRYRDIRWKMSSVFSSLEIPFKNLLGRHFKRGIFDVSIHYKKSTENETYSNVDFEKFESFVKKMKIIATQNGLSTSVGVGDILRSEFQLERDDNDEGELKSLAKDAFEKAIEELKESRSQEGEKLLEILKDHRSLYQLSFNVIQERADEFKKHLEDKLKKRIAEYSEELNIEESRLLQEVVFYLEKMDIHEEINRIESHLKKLDELLGGQKVEIGRQIDFLVQELNRETNTIGSKSHVSEVSENVVQMKVQLEKIREQGLNLE